MRSLFFEELEVGQEFTSTKRLLSSTDIKGFADLTGDHAAIHLDAEYAATTPFQRPIAHGLLGTSLSAGLATTTPPLEIEAFIALKEWQFRRPIFAGDTIHIKQTVISMVPKRNGRRGVIDFKVEVFNQEGKLVQEGITSLLVRQGLGKVAAPADGQDLTLGTTLQSMHTDPNIGS